VVAQAAGVDLNAGAIHKGRPGLPENATLYLLEEKGALPFPDAFFDSISILDVLEHIIDQHHILKALHRVLKPGAPLIVTVPKRNLLSFLDTGNFKFHFPRLHRLFYSLANSPEEYHKRYVACENGLFGDIEKGKGCHQHFSERELQELLEACGFKVVRFDGSGLFERFLILVESLLPRFLRGPMQKLKRLDAETFASSNLFCLAERT
jgi:ubiquinone/menaquinone biosynthesis C-methylase UbiE